MARLCAFVGIIGVIALLLHACGGGGTGNPNVDGPRSAASCVATNYVTSTISGIETSWLRATNNCAQTVFFQFCVDDRDPALGLGSTVNEMAFCAVASTFSYIKGASLGPGDEATIAPGQYSDFMLATAAPGAANPGVHDFLSSPVYTVAFTLDFTCSGTFKSGQGYVFSSCASVS